MKWTAIRLCVLIASVTAAVCGGAVAQQGQPTGPDKPPVVGHDESATCLEGRCMRLWPG